jgi:hypothetical protein
MRSRVLRASLSMAIVSLAVMLLLLSKPKPGYAIPAFARQYGTSCATCHLDFPKLNDFGKAFKDAGFKFPKDDEALLKVPPVMLGAPANAELWPKTIWPGKIPGLPPIGLRMNNFFHVVGRRANNFQFAPTDATEPFVPASVPRTDFAPGLFSMFTAGNFGSGIAFWVDDDLSVGGDGAAGGLGDGYLKFVDLGRLVHLPHDSFNVRMGQFELDLPFSPARSWNISAWDIFDQPNLGVVNPAFAQQNVNNGVTLGDPARGVEISGGHHYGGYWYSLAAFNQNTTGIVNDSSIVPSATGSSSGGLGFFSDSNFKDIYGRFMYRFNLERDTESRHAIQAAGPLGPREHTYLALGTFYYYGRSVQRFLGANTAGENIVLTARQPFYRAGADFSFNVRTFNLFGVYMYGRDHNLIPIDASGAPFPSAAPVGFIHGAPATFGGGFVEADYLAVPWVMLIMRWDAVNSTADRINGLASLPDTPFFGPVKSTRSRITPGVQFLVRANIKAAFEYQIRPRQQIVAGINPLTLEPITIPPFRVNTATADLEFVF